jgi:hypothetical protein
MISRWFSLSSHIALFKTPFTVAIPAAYLIQSVATVSQEPLDLLLWPAISICLEPALEQSCLSPLQPSSLRSKCLDSRRPDCGQVVPFRPADSSPSPNPELRCHLTDKAQLRKLCHPDRVCTADSFSPVESLVYETSLAIATLIILVHRHLEAMPSLDSPSSHRPANPVLPTNGWLTGLAVLSSLTFISPNAA